MKTKYPTLNGKPMDPIRKREFNALRKLFRWTIANAAGNKGEVLSSAALSTAAWNCAFEAVTATRA